MRRPDSIRLGTRGSDLALAQAGIVAGMISNRVPGMKVEIVPIRTSGDRWQEESSGSDRKLAFTSEIDRELLDGSIDIAVHSLKDVPSEIDPQLVIAATPPRADARDALVTASGDKLAEIPPGSRIGTSSVRRRVQLRLLAPGAEVVEVRGNVGTRIEKMRGGLFDGLVLAAAGLQRLGLASQITEYFSWEDMVPASCQGVMAVVSRADASDIVATLGAVDDPHTHAESACERAFLERLGGDCDFPAGVHARLVGEELEVVGMVANPDGTSLRKDRRRGPRLQAKELGKELAARLLEKEGETAARPR